MTSQPPANPNRYITDNDEDGKSFFSTTIPESLPVTGDLGGALQRLGYTTEQAPMTLTDATDLKAYETSLTEPPPLVRQGGAANVWYIDTPPSGESPMHRTASLDIVIQISGEIELTMSNGETRLVKPGDMTVQRSTLHKWRNPSETQWSRFVGILMECQPVVTENEGALGTYFPAH